MTFAALTLGLAPLPRVQANDIFVNVGNSAIVPDGLCALAEAIQNANDDGPTHSDCPPGSGPDTITLTMAVAVDGTTLFPAVAGHTDFGPSGLPDITSDITIARRAITRTGAADYRFLVVRHTGSLTIDGVTIGNGRVVGDCKLFGVGDRSGCGGALVSEAGAIALLDTTFEDNHALEAAATDLPQGGAILALGGTLSATTSAFASNGAGVGGAIAAYFATMAFTDTTFTDNEAVASGGAIHNGQVGQLTILGSTFSGNQVTATPFSFLGGGAINNAGSASDLVAVNSRFEHNSAAFGGALLNFNASEATLINTTLAHNEAHEGGAILNRGSGATLNLFASTVTNNSLSAFGDGGGISNGGSSDSGITLVRNSLVAGNTSGSDGGGILTAGSLMVEASAIHENVAAGRGGGIFVRSLTNQTVELADSSISGNLAGSDGGGLYYTTNPSGTSVNNLVVTNSTFDGNEADSGGGLYADYTDVSVTGSTFSNNVSSSVGTGGGGGLHVRSFIVGGAVVTVVNSTVSGNSAHQDGGGVYLAGSALTASLQSVTIAGNSAASLNGADGLHSLAPIADVVVADSAVAFNAERNCVDFPGFGVTDGGGNISTDSTCGFADSGGAGIGDGVDPMLDVLADNGGNTQTHALLAGSPGIDAGAGCPPTDQRGAAREDACDIGAYETPGSSASLSISADTLVVFEAGETTATVSVTLDNTAPDAKAVEVRVPLRVTGNATGVGGDYTLSNQQGLAAPPAGRVSDLVFDVGAGATETQTFLLTAVDDVLLEHDELVEIAAGVVGNALFGGDNVVAITVVSDEKLPDLIVMIDIKPGSYPNSINLRNRGTVPVAILSSVGFDAATVDPLTIDLAGAGVRTKRNGSAQVSLEDVNGDGLLDLVGHVPTGDLDLNAWDETASLVAQTYDGLAVAGSDSVRIVPP